MKRLVLALLIALSSSAMAQQPSRTAELDKAVEEARVAYLALQEAEKRRNEGIESLPGERQGSAAGGSRPTDEYRGRQAQLEQDVESARRRYDYAVKRWNDLK
jgi:type II secretory pathway pseudopilin PulG